MRQLACVVCTLLLLLVAVAPARAEAAQYARPELLLEPAELARPATAAQFIVLDARSAEDYEQGHIPGARHLDPQSWAKAFTGDGEDDAAAWSARIGDLGIGPTSKVVVYDDEGMKDAARIWWILRYWGLDDVRLLNGGWKGWKAAELPVATDVPQITPVEFQATPRVARLMTGDQVLAALQDRALQIVDARSEEEHCGIDRQKNERAGAIPSAKHLEFSDLLDADTQRFKSPAELRRLFAAAGIDLNRPSATHCQGGGRASVMAFGMELMGGADVRNYYRGWGEWGNRDDTPTETPKSAD